MFIGSWEKKSFSLAAGRETGEEGFISKGAGSRYEDGEIWVCFFGTLYNKEETGFAGESTDAEAAALMYRREGAEGFARLDGSFTCILRTVSGLVLVVRDHHGTSLPVYYDDTFFASSPALLQEAGGCTKGVDYPALSTFLAVGYIPLARTAFKGVRKLGGGKALVYDGGRLDTKDLYPAGTIEPAVSSRSPEEWAEAYAALHREAIRRRIGTSDRVGILLSGGYDSGCNLAALRRVYTGDIHSFSIGFKGDNWTELPLARCMSETFGTVHAEYEIDGSEIAALPELVGYLGDPFVEGGLMVNYAAMKLAAGTNPDVILGGDANDQYFGTSGREVALHYLLARTGLKPVAQGVFRLLSRPAFDGDGICYRVRFHLDKILNILQGDLFGFPRFRLEEMVREPSFLPERPKTGTGRCDTRSFEHLYTQHAYESDLDKVVNQVILFKASRMADLFGQSLVFPYTDLALYRFLTTLPVEYKCRGANVKEIARGRAAAKFLLKFYYKPMLPEAITAKKKQGGFAPMPLFFQDGRQRARLADYIMQSAVTRDFLKREAVEAFLRRYDAEADEPGRWFWYRQNKAIQYFNLLTLAVWWERFVEGRTPVLG